MFTISSWTCLPLSWLLLRLNRDCCSHLFELSVCGLFLAFFHFLLRGEVCFFSCSHSGLKVGTWTWVRSGFREYRLIVSISDLSILLLVNFVARSVFCAGRHHMCLLHLLIWRISVIWFWNFATCISRAKCGFSLQTVESVSSKCALLSVDVPLQVVLTKNTLDSVAWFVHSEQLWLADNRFLTKGIPNILAGFGWIMPCVLTYHWFLFQIELFCY